MRSDKCVKCYPSYIKSSELIIPARHLTTFSSTQHLLFILPINRK